MIVKNNGEQVFSYPIVTYHDKIKEDNFSWEYALSEEWDSLRIVSLIKKYGMPETVAARIYLLENINNRLQMELQKRNPGDQYDVVYEDLCDYCPAFRRTYGFTTIRKALTFANITNCYNLRMNLSKSKLSEELQLATLYVFPIIHRPDYFKEYERSL